MEEWGGIAPEIRIGNVERLPIGIFRCPASNRRPKTMEGVPITYGCKATMDKIAACFFEIEKNMATNPSRYLLTGTCLTKV